MSRISTIVFDLSGVLLNYIMTVWKADSDAYQALGLPKRETMQETQTARAFSTLKPITNTQT